MRYTAKQVAYLFGAMDPNEVIHLSYRHHDDCVELGDDDYVTKSDLSRLADYEGREEDLIDEVIRDLMRMRPRDMTINSREGL